MFSGIGPLKFNLSSDNKVIGIYYNDGVESNPKSWAWNYSILFIESTVTTGYSYTNDNYNPSSTQNVWKNNLF